MALDINGHNATFNVFVKFADDSMRTVHYGTIPDLKTPDGNGPNRRLFLKCESHGCFHNPLSKEDEAAGMTPNMHQREARDGDWSEAILHTFSFWGRISSYPRRLQRRCDFRSRHSLRSHELTFNQQTFRRIKHGCKG